MYLSKVDLLSRIGVQKTALVEARINCDSYVSVLDHGDVQSIHTIPPFIAIQKLRNLAKYVTIDQNVQQIKKIAGLFFVLVQER